MPKLTVEDLKKIKEQQRALFSLREGKFRVKVTVHMGTCGLAAGARDVMDALLEEINNANVTDVMVTTSGCAGLCAKEPMATVEIQGSAPVKYVFLNKDKIRRIFKEHILGGKPVEEYALVVGSETAY